MSVPKIFGMRLWTGPHQWAKTGARQTGKSWAAHSKWRVSRKASHAQRAEGYESSVLRAGAYLLRGGGVE